MMMERALRAATRERRLAMLAEAHVLDGPAPALATDDRYVAALRPCDDRDERPERLVVAPTLEELAHRCEDALVTYGYTPGAVYDLADAQRFAELGRHVRAAPHWLPEIVSATVTFGPAA